MENNDKHVTKYIVQPGTKIKCFLLGGLLEENQYEISKQEVILSTIERIKREGTLQNIIEKLKTVSPILVTGSSGYLGSAIVQVLQLHGVRVVGIDLIDSPTTDFVGCVSDTNFVTKSSADCKSVIHTAALHAPNLAFYSDEDYQKVNVKGTENVLSAAKDFQFKGVVFSSTTSLMNTNLSKQRENESRMGPNIINNATDNGIPRNIYGLTKKEAEKLCIDNKHVNIAILRCSRFFLEDQFDTATNTAKSIEVSNGNAKANEIIYGTRASLEDVILSHLIALDKISGREMCNEVIGPLIISSISPLLSSPTDVSFVTNSKLFKTLGWSFPERVSRIYDSTSSWKALNFTPKWDFNRLSVEYFNCDCTQMILDGLY